jgi:hypothetical protein
MYRVYPIETILVKKITSHKEYGTRGAHLPNIIKIDSAVYLIIFIMYYKYYIFSIYLIKFDLLEGENLPLKIGGGSIYLWLPPAP